MPALQLFDVDDAQAVVRGIVTRSGLRLSFHEREDLEQYLLVQMWELSLRYDPSRGMGFGAWAVTTLKSGSSTTSGASSGRRGSSATGSTNGRARASSMSINFETLSPRSTAILRQIGTRILDGYGPKEIASALGISRSSVLTLLSELRNELAGPSDEPR